MSEDDCPDKTTNKFEELFLLFGWTPKEWKNRAKDLANYAFGTF